MSVSFGEERLSDFFTNHTLQAIGQPYGKTPAQVALRYLIQRDVVVIPKTVTKARMIQNFDVFDFELTKEDMGKIAGLDQKETLFFDHTNPETVEMFVNVGK